MPFCQAYTRGIEHLILLNNNWSGTILSDKTYYIIHLNTYTDAALAEEYM